MTADQLFARIVDNPRLPTPPAVVLQVLEKVNDPECTVHDLERIISYDPALCGKILRIVNSALYTLAQPITSVKHALNLLGMKRVRSLVLSMSVPALGAKTLTGRKLQDYWKTSVAAGIIAQELARHQGSTDPENALAAGLLCDLGVLILHGLFPEEYERVLCQPGEVLVQRQCRIERELFGADHAEVSAFMLKRWHLPDELCEAVRCHHRPEAVPPERPAVVGHAYHLFFAYRVAQMETVSYQSILLADMFRLARTRFGMHPPQLAEFLEPLTKKIEEYASLLDMNLGASPHYGQLLSQATENLGHVAVEANIESMRAQEEKSRVEEGFKKTTETLRQTEEQFRQAQKMEAVGRLTGGVAHDFNNLLTVIEGYSEVLLTTLSPEDPAHTLVGEIKKAGARATELSRQLLAFSRKQVSVPSVLDLNQIVSGMEKMLRRLLGEDIKLVTQLEPCLYPVLADPGQIEQVLMNLAVNARDAMLSGGLLTIATANMVLDAAAGAAFELSADRYAVMSVTDTGTGMSPDTKARIFEPFFTTKEQGKGTGLGLATVHGIIKESKGHISCDTELGRGTTFKVYLPFTGSQILQMHENKPSAEQLRGSETILVAEDEDGVRHVARRALEMHGYQVLEARHGREALIVSEEHHGPIHLLLTDTIMPEMSGCELAACLAQRRQGLRVLFTSGYSDEIIFRPGLLAPGAPFLQKPYSPTGLVEKVREILAGS